MPGTIVTVAVPILAICLVFIYAPPGYLKARHGETPAIMVQRTFLGPALLIVAAASSLMQAAILPSFLPYIAFWLGLSVTLSALPYWLVRIFKPTASFFERLDHEIAIRYEPDRYHSTEDREDGDRPT